MWLIANNNDDVLEFIAYQCKFGGDIEIRLPDGTLVKGTQCEWNNHVDSGLTAHMTDGVYTFGDLRESVEALIRSGDAFITSIGTSAPKLDRRWTRLKPGR